MKKEELYEIVKNATFEPTSADLSKMSQDEAFLLIEKQVLGDIKKAFNRFGEVVLFNPSSLHGCHTKNEITMMDIVRGGGEYKVSLVNKVLEKHNIQMPIKFDTIEQADKLNPIPEIEDEAVENKRVNKPRRCR